MTLEDFISLNYNAVQHLYNTKRMRLLTEDPYYLSGEATVCEAMVLLLQAQLSDKRRLPDEAMSPKALKARQRARGEVPKMADLKTSRYLGVSRASGRDLWVARGKVAGKVTLCSHHKTQLEAALAYDAWVREVRPQGRTNASMGLLPEGA